MIKRNIEALVYLTGSVVMIALSLLLKFNEQLVYTSVFNIQLGNIYQCPIDYYLHVPCPTCGLTRAFILFADFKFTDAFRYNAGVFLLYPYIVAQIPLQIIAIVKKEKGISNRKLNKKNLIALILIGILLIIIWALKLFHLLPNL